MALELNECEGTRLISLNEDVDAFNPLPLDLFYNRLPDTNRCKQEKRKIRKYYNHQYEIIKSFEKVNELVGHMPRDTLITPNMSRKGSILSILDSMVGHDTGVWRGSRLNALPPPALGDAESTPPPVVPPEAAKPCCVGMNFLHSRSGQTFLAKLTLGCNAVLMLAKLAASIISGSLSVISSLLDSCVDLLSGAVLWWAAWSMKRSDARLYPHGRTRLEPIAIVILAVIMSVASFQMIREGTERIVEIANNAPSDNATDVKSGPDMTNTAIGITASTIVTKIILYLLCRVYGESSSVRALADDNRNDVFSNSVALVFSTLSSRLGVYNLRYLDPVGAIIVALYIIFSWFQTGKEHVQSLTGLVASPEFHQKICFIALSHHPAVMEVDTVLALHFGQNYMVEVHIVLPHDMHLAMAHNIGEALQRKLESLPEVERAFVHLDYESRHRSTFEHKLVL